MTIEIPAVWVPARRRWESPDGRYYFSQREADRACDFFPEFLTHHIGEWVGQPFVLMDWQALLLTRPIFGWLHATGEQAGLRRFRKLFAFVPKGAGKSPWAAGTGLYLMLCDYEAAAEVYALAADRNQARVVHSNAKVMVEGSLELLKRCEITRDSIVCQDLRASYQVLSADAGTKHGIRPHGAIFDELHAVRNRDLFEAVTKSMVKRRQPLIVIITHAGTDDEGICGEEYDYAKRVLAGQVVDDTVLPVIFEIQEGEDWIDPDVWRRVNPGHGITVKHAAIVTECIAAQAEPRKRNDFLRFHLNKWTSQASAWIPIEWWDACKRPITDAELAGLECAGGLDLAQKWDLAAFVVLFRRPLGAGVAATALEITTEDVPGQAVTRRLELNYELIAVPFFWIPEASMLQHEHEDGVPYTIWRESRLVRVTEGPTIDYTRIYHDITTEIAARFPKLKQGRIGFDPAFATDIATNLRDRGGFTVEEVLQAYTHMSEPALILEALIKGKRVHHDGHRTLRWNWENVAVKRDDAGRIKPVKPRNHAKRIDGAVAMIMATRMLVLMEPPPPKQYQIMVFGPSGSTPTSTPPRR